MAVIIQESDMRFGEYEEEQVFQMEKSRQYTDKLMPNGIIENLENPRFYYHE